MPDAQSCRTYIWCAHIVENRTFPRISSLTEKDEHAAASRVVLVNCTRFTDRNFSGKGPHRMGKNGGSVRIVSRTIRPCGESYTCLVLYPLQSPVSIPRYARKTCGSFRRIVSAPKPKESEPKIEWVRCLSIRVDLASASRTLL